MLEDAGIRDLSARFSYPTNALHHFFKVAVEMP